MEVILKNFFSKERILLLILASSQFTHIMDFMIMMPLGPQLMRIFGISPGEFSLLVSAYTFSAGIIGFVATFFLDRFDRRSAILFIYAGFIVGTIACAFSPNYLILLMCRSLTGAFGGILGALVLSIVGDAIPHERRGAAIGTVMAAFSAASVFGVPFGLYLASIFNWHSPFIFLGIAGVLIWILLFRIMPVMRDHLEERSERKGPLTIILDFAKDKNVINALLFTICLIMGQFSVIPFISPYMVKNVGFTEIQLSYIYLIGGGLTFFSSPLIGKLADRYGKINVFTTFGVLAVIPILFTTHLPPVSIFLALLVTSSFFVIVSGRMIPATTMVTSVVLPRKRGSFMSLRTAVLQMTSGTASLIAGLIIIESESGELLNYDYVGYFAVFFSLIALYFGRKLKVAD
ncbi:MAG: MFS transporter [Cytophagales bacterium]